ncbi:MAG: phosphohistidine phosphatase SixA [Magnetococcales bacterium]|nr:phosphohistidine phosphatase SixA [Magnetococcales bacterium]
MVLLLAHHGDAVAKDIDPERPLTPQGIADVKKMARFLAAAGICPARILHSDKVRARETARLFRSQLAPDVELEEVAGIRPDDAVAPFASQVDNWQTDTLVAGHGPFMARLISLLLAGPSQPDSLVATRPGSVVALERNAAGGWSLAWMVRPELLGS